MVLSILDMGNASYGGITASQLNSLQKVQNAATRFVFGLYGKKKTATHKSLSKEASFSPSLLPNQI